MRSLLLSLALFAGTIASLGDRTSDRWCEPVEDQILGECFGTSPNTVQQSAEVCAGQNITPNTGEQTAGACASGPPYPFGPCIDCGTQSNIISKMGSYSGLMTNANLPCSSIVLKTGSCIRDKQNNYYCANAVPNANNSTCAGAFQKILSQAN